MHNTALHELLTHLTTLYNLPSPTSAPLHVSADPAIPIDDALLQIENTLKKLIPILPPNPTFLAQTRFSAHPSFRTSSLTLHPSAHLALPYLVYSTPTDYSPYRHTQPKYADSAIFASFMDNILALPMPITCKPRATSTLSDLRSQLLFISILLYKHFKLNPWQTVHNELSQVHALLQSIPPQTLSTISPLHTPHPSNPLRIKTTTPHRHYFGDPTPHTLELHFEDKNKRKPLPLATLSPSYSTPSCWNLLPSNSPCLPGDSALAVSVLNALQHIAPHHTINL